MAIVCLQLLLLGVFSLEITGLPKAQSSYHGSQSYNSTPPCRFAPSFNQAQILQNPEPFIWDVLYWEGKFAQPGIGYNGDNAMSYDGTLLDPITGLAVANAGGRHNFSAASKESLQVMVYAHALAGDRAAARFVSPGSPRDAPEIAYQLMQKKLATYLAFNASFPGFGGYLPWYNNTNANIEPTWDWVCRAVNPCLNRSSTYLCFHRSIECLGSTTASFSGLSTPQCKSFNRAADPTSASSGHDGRLG